jgi:predicted dehydrogenase
MRARAAKLQAGVIGLGMGRNHAAGYATHPRCRLLAVCDADLDLARQIAHKHGAKYVFREWRKLVEMEELDLLSVATPNYLHARMTIAALKAGKHVLCEKPMATRLADAEAMVKAARRTGKRLMLNMSYRFHPMQQRLHQRILRGDLGDLYYAKSHYTRRHGTPGSSRSWFVSKRKAGGGPSVDLGVHALDLVWWHLGSPKPTWALGGTFGELIPHRLGTVGSKDNVDDLACAMVKFATGQIAFFEASWEGHQPGHEGFEIYGTKGGASCRDWESDLKMTLHFDDRRGRPVDLPLKSSRKKLSAYWHFVDACLDPKLPLLAAGDECLPIARLLDALQQSQRTGKAVAL